MKNKNLLLLLLALFCSFGCKRYQYTFDYFKVKENSEVSEAYKYVMDKSVFLKTELNKGEYLNVDEFSKYRIDLYKCEKEVDAIIVSAIENQLSDCDGEIFGHHRFDLIAFKQEKGLIFFFFSSELNETKDLVIGPISMFIGSLYQQSNGDSVIKFQEKFVRNQRKKIQWVIEKDFDMDIVLREKIKSDKYFFKQSAIGIEKIIYRNPNKISGNKPIAFDFENIIESKIDFLMVN